MKFKEITGGGNKSCLWTKHKVFNLVRIENPMEDVLEYQFLAYCPMYNRQRENAPDRFPVFSKKMLFPLIDGISSAVRKYQEKADEIGLESEVKVQSEVPAAYSITFRIADEDKLRSRISEMHGALTKILDDRASLLTDAGAILDQTYLEGYVSYCLREGISID